MVHFYKNSILKSIMDTVSVCILEKHKWSEFHITGLEETAAIYKFI